MNSSLGLYNYESELIKDYKGHVNNQYLIDAKFFKNKETGKYLILSGSEDGCIYGWDLNSQRLQIKLPIIAEMDDCSQNRDTKTYQTIFELDYD